MGDKQDKKINVKGKNEPTFDNDQLGENSSGIHPDNYKQKGQDKKKRK